MSKQTKPLNKEACRIIDALGGTNEVARICNVKPPSVSDWRFDGIPDARLMYLKVIRPDVFGITDSLIQPPNKHNRTQIRRKADKAALEAERRNSGIDK